MPSVEQFKRGDIIIGTYRVLDVFGGHEKSGMGVVYLVEGRNTPFPVVLKTFQGKTPQLQRSFLREAKSWVALGLHPNIVQARFVREINNQIFVEAEYIAPDKQGRNTVGDFIRNGPARNGTILRWCAQFCYAMEYASSRGVIAHRDVKPENLMVTADGHLKVTDFGIAKTRHTSAWDDSNPDGADAARTAAGAFKGTYWFAAPEQLNASSKVDLRSDIYSFGIVLYQLITSGRFPYAISSRPSEQELAVAHIVQPIIEVEHPLFFVVEKALAKAPQDRYQSYADLLLDLQSVAERFGDRLPKNPGPTPDHVKFYERYMEGHASATMGNPRKALDLVDESLRLNAEYSPAWNLKATVLGDLNRDYEAIDCMIRALELEPENPICLSNLGGFYARVGEYDKGISYLMEAIRLDGYSPVAVVNLAVALQMRGSRKAAAEIILKALWQAPDSQPIRRTAAQIAESFILDGETEKALEILQKLEGLKASNPRYENHRPPDPQGQ